MNKIAIEKDGKILQVITLPAGSYRIGRAKDNDLVLNDPTVSAHHARIMTFFDASYVADLKSTNGTAVNDRPIREHTLHDGDVVMIGSHVLRFISQGKQQLDPDVALTA